VRKKKNSKRRAGVKEYKLAERPVGSGGKKRRVVKGGEDSKIKRERREESVIPN